MATLTFTGRDRYTTLRGTTGIGRAAAIRLAADGYAVTLLDRDYDELDAVQRALETDGGRAVGIGVDVTDADAVESAVAQAAELLGPPRVLINCAGIILRKGLLATTPDEWDRVLRVNLSGYFHLLRAVVPYMQSAGGGSIIQIASSAAHLGGHGYPSYTASKGAIISLTRMLAHELAPSGIRINSISPGAIATAINSDTLSDPSIRDAMVGAIPLGRFGQPEDLAGAVSFLAGSESAFITGIDVPVDGGLISRVTFPAADAYSRFSE